MQMQQQQQQNNCFYPAAHNTGIPNDQQQPDNDDDDNYQQDQYSQSYNERNKHRNQCNMNNNLGTLPLSDFSQAQSYKKYMQNLQPVLELRKEESEGDINEYERSQQEESVPVKKEGYNIQYVAIQPKNIASAAKNGQQPLQNNSNILNEQQHQQQKNQIQQTKQEKPVVGNQTQNKQMSALDKLRVAQQQFKESWNGISTIHTGCPGTSILCNKKRQFLVNDEQIMEEERGIQFVKIFDLVNQLDDNNSTLTVSEPGSAGQSNKLGGGFGIGNKSSQNFYQKRQQQQQMMDYNGGDQMLNLYSCENINNNQDCIFFNTIQMSQLLQDTPPTQTYQRGGSHQMSSLSKNELQYKILRGDTKLVRSLLEANGFSYTESHDWNILWASSSCKAYLYEGLNEHQRINHFPSSYEITRKDRLCFNLTKMQERCGKDNIDFVPDTYILPQEYGLFVQHFERLARSGEAKSKNVWIVKPANLSRGRGIHLIDDLREVNCDELSVISRYVTNPLLINGHKFDLRIYVVITCYDPLRIYIYKEGLARFASVSYSSKIDKDNKFMHLTNYSINKKNDNFKQNENHEQDDFGFKWSLSAFCSHLQQVGIDMDLLWSRIYDVIIKTTISGENYVLNAQRKYKTHRQNCFEVFGYDILLDSDLKPWLVEVNLSPSLAAESPLDLTIKGNLIADTFNLVGVKKFDRRKDSLQKIRNRAGNKAGGGAGGGIGGGSTSFKPISTQYSNVIQPQPNGNSNDIYLGQTLNPYVADLIDRIVEEFEQDYPEMQDSIKQACLVKSRDIISESVSENSRKGENFIRIYPAKNSNIYDQYFVGPRPLNKLLYKVLCTSKIIKYLNPNGEKQKQIHSQQQINDNNALTNGGVNKGITKLKTQELMNEVDTQIQSLSNQQNKQISKTLNNYSQQNEQNSDDDHVLSKNKVRGSVASKELTKIQQQQQQPLAKPSNSSYNNNGMTASSYMQQNEQNNTNTDGSAKTVVYSNHYREDAHQVSRAKVANSLNQGNSHHQQDLTNQSDYSSSSNNQQNPQQYTSSQQTKNQQNQQIDNTHTHPQQQQQQKQTEKVLITGDDILIEYVTRVVSALKLIPEKHLTRLQVESVNKFINHYVWQQKQNNNDGLTSEDDTSVSSSNGNIKQQGYLGSQMENRLDEMLERRKRLLKYMSKKEGKQYTNEEFEDFYQNNIRKKNIVIGKFSSLQLEDLLRQSTKNVAQEVVSCLLNQISSQQGILIDLEIQQLNSKNNAMINSHQRDFAQEQVRNNTNSSNNASDGRKSQRPPLQGTQTLQPVGLNRKQSSPRRATLTQSRGGNTGGQQPQKSFQRAMSKSPREISGGNSSFRYTSTNGGSGNNDFNRSNVQSSKSINPTTRSKHNLNQQHDNSLKNFSPKNFNTSTTKIATKGHFISDEINNQQQQQQFNFKQQPASTTGQHQKPSQRVTAYQSLATQQQNSHKLSTNSSSTQRLNKNYPSRHQDY